MRASARAPVLASGSGCSSGLLWRPSGTAIKAGAERGEEGHGAWAGNECNTRRVAAAPASDVWRHPPLPYLAIALARYANTVRMMFMYLQIPVERWDDKLFSFEPFHHWVMNSSIYRRQVSVVASRQRVTLC